MARPRRRPTKKAKQKERREARRRHMSVEQWRQAKGQSPDGTVTRDYVR